MKVKEAYSILELEETATLEEAKKQFRKMSKKLHPDNKETGDEAKFKQINEAYQIISDPKKAEREDLHWNQPSHAAWGNTPFTNPFGRTKVYFSQPASVRTTVSFSESVLGCQKEIKLNRTIKCANCSGEGFVSINNGCPDCGGRGTRIVYQGNMIITMQCGKCAGRQASESCKTCQTKGVVEAESILQVNIPGGVINGNTLILRGVGNFAGAFGPHDQYTDAHLMVHVTPEPGLSIEGEDVVSSVEMPLQEALAGCKKIVKTIDGYRDVDIKPLSRHKDEVIIPHLGVNRKGNQRVVLDVKYPTDVSKLIEILNDSLNYKVN